MHTRKQSTKIMKILESAMGNVKLSFWEPLFEIEFPRHTTAETNATQVALIENICEGNIAVCVAFLNEISLEG
jgi:hypothetical protein